MLCRSRQRWPCWSKRTRGHSTRCTQTLRCCDGQMTAYQTDLCDGQMITCQTDLNYRRHPHHRGLGHVLVMYCRGESSSLLVTLCVMVTMPDFGESRQCGCKHRARRIRLETGMRLRHPAESPSRLVCNHNRQLLYSSGGSSVRGCKQKEVCTAGAHSTPCCCHSIVTAVANTLI